eukprot:7568811-Alexandrium_andersonii.AAC.1
MFQQLRTTENDLACSKLELRRPKNSLKAAPQSSQGVHSVPLLAQMPKPQTRRAGGRTGGASRSCLNSSGG